jgi:hypothetical protein
MSYSPSYQKKRKKELIYTILGGLIIFVIAMIPFFLEESISIDGLTEIYNTINDCNERDKYQNPNCATSDLVKDQAFKNVKIAVLHLYTKEGFDFVLPTSALQSKGFIVNRWANEIPSIDEFKQTLNQSSQLWVISDAYTRIPETHLKEIEKFFHQGKGLYLWGDNKPYYADTNVIANRLLSVELEGNDQGRQVIDIKNLNNHKKNHHILFGINHLFEGVTISSIKGQADGLKPVLYSSHGKVVIAAYEKNGKRLIIDGGDTRLFVNWDTAGTARYVKNAAGWLTNYERFKKEIFRRNKRK